MVSTTRHDSGAAQMNITSRLALALTMVATVAAPCTFAQQPPAAYPAKGQSADKQRADQDACMSWARSNAPTQAVPAQQTGPAVGGGQRLAGAARGAAAGAVIGGVANGDSGRGAGVGATAGVVAGGVRARRARAEQNQAASNVQAQNDASVSQAYGACMKGRGYTIN
jgi:hypothetical protein